MKTNSEVSGAAPETVAPASNNGKATRAKASSAGTEAAAAAAAEGRASANISVADLAQSFSKQRAGAPKAGKAGAGAERTEGTERTQGTEEGSSGEVEQAQEEAAEESIDTEQPVEGAAAEAGEESADTDAEQEGEATGEEAAEGEEQDQEQEQGPEAGPLAKKYKKSLKRIDNLTKRLRTVEEALAATQGAQDPKGPPKGGTPAGTYEFASHPVLAEINANLGVVNGALKFVDENPEGGEYVDEKGGRREFTAAEVRTIKRNAEASRTELLTERAATVQQLRQAHQAEATKAEKEFAASYPALMKRDTAEGMEFEQTVAQAPELRRFPDYKLWIADAMAGRKARLAATAAKNNGQVKRPLGAPMVKPKGSSEPPNVVTQPAAGAPRVNAKQKQAQVAEEAFEKSGRVDDLAKVFSAKRAARLQAA